ncbi:MAG: HlyD family secretion protein [Alphaproteobacteria bacterium]|nr:HlyD family secretion protein [Alphaproteobacteria bacterium]MDE2012492.1 HlyD family secretion protein [Alphaproteobacteria bacterium]MDE2072790.1 HlyD family secretion protein [Alphaproteobacteria bacterium]MDE2352381.1 HlyD family secretion protein [Alphaproteobacteria bacterium]
MSALQGDTSANSFRQPGQGVIAQGRDLVRRLAADRAQLRRVLMIAGVVAVALGALVSWLMGGRYVSTDDAYVQAAKLMVSTDVSGLVQDVDVKEGQVVKKGQILFRLDPKPFRIALANAVATRDQTALTVDSMKQDYKRMLSDISAQKAQVDLAQRNYDRDVRLLKAGAVSQSDYDTARATLAAARDQFQALKDAAATQLAKLGGNIDIPTRQLPQYLQAQAQVDEAQRQLNHSVIRAPFNGVVAEVDSLQPGTLVISAMSAFSTTSAVGLVATDNEWIEAHMKETDLTHVKVGDPVSYTIDTYPGRTWQGHVQAISAGTGSAFSVLPAENASGNWVKVVQRIPVKVAIDRKPGDPTLRAGMSTIVDIDTGHRRWYRMLFGG